MKAKTLAVTTLCVLLLILGIVLAFYFSHFTTVQKKSSPDDSHRAKLIRIDGIDVNFKVIVDGERVFWSADFTPVAHDFREQINWDSTGKIVVLEVAGQRIFGYDALQKRKLGDEELLAVSYAPFAEYRYEGKLPGASLPAKSK